MAPDLGHFREDYSYSELRRDDLAPDPFQQFQRWWDEWTATDRFDAAACVLATASADGVPSARYVLCRDFGPDGFVVYTNLEGRKGRELTANPRGALVFGWLSQNRQVRVEGPVETVSAEVSDRYWQSRPRGSQLAAWASDQSEVLADRAELERHVDDVTERFGGVDGGDFVPRPEFWGGFRLIPERVEFWQGRADRLHDRFEFRRTHGDGWEAVRLSP